jgi:hypothetical protein
MIHHQQRADLWRVDLDLCDPDRIRLKYQRVTFYGFMVDITNQFIVFMEIPSWFINQGSHHIANLRYPAKNDKFFAGERRYSH